MKKIILSLLVIAAALTLSAPVSWAWEKDQGISCERVFASIKNDGTLRNWNGVVNANAVDVVTTSGSDNTTNFVTVEWIPTPGFSGSVQATITLVGGDFNTVSADLDCPAPSPTPTPTPTPTPQVNTGGPGDGRSDGLGCASRDCNTTPHQQVLGASTGQAVLGLSTTSSDNNLMSFAQLLGALALSTAGFSFFKKNKNA